MVVARGDKLSKLYVFQGSMSRDLVNLVENDTSSELWHRKLSHMSEKGIDSLAKKNLLSGVKQEKLKKRVHCLAGKQKEFLLRVIRLQESLIYWSWYILICVVLLR